MMIVVLAGVAGSGKTTVGRALAARLGWAFEDADALHSPADIAKMHSGAPLTDADRWPWLEAVAAWLDARIAADTPAVVACSVLKRSYRDFLYRDRPAVQIVMLQAEAAVLTSRLIARRGHFFPTKLLQSQLADLEMPDHAERTLVVPTVHSPAEIADEIIRRLGLTPAPRGGLPQGMPYRSSSLLRGCHEGGMGRRAGPRCVVVVANSSAMGSSSALRSIPPDSPLATA